MNKNEAITAIKNATKAIAMLFSTNEDATEIPAEFEAVKRVDSDELVDVQGELAVGSIVVTSTAMGSQEAADDTYSLANGVEFSTKGGKIDKVIKAPVEDAKEADAPAPVEGSPEEEATETPVAEAKEEAATAPAPTEEAAPVAPDNTAAIATLVQKITELDTMINTIKTALEGKASNQAMSALGEQFNAIKGAFEVLSDTPAEFSKVDKSLEARDEKKRRLEALAAMLNK